MTWIPATSAYPMMTWYQVWYQTSIQISTSPNQNPTGIGSRLRPTGSKSDGKISSEVNLVTKLDHNYTHNYAIVPKLQPGNFYHMYVKACNNAGCSQSINRMFDFPTTSPQSQHVRQEVNLKEMTILEVTLSLVVGCLTIALCYLIGVLVICVKKIRTLEDLTNNVVVNASGMNNCVAKIHETESNNNTLTGYPMKVPMGANQNLAIPRSYLAQLDAAGTMKESIA
ncbi:uncharacterized protein LOC142352765 [Convolutriloba macropyga]|uniref:uncharacterized protein LOC142352765 n=1 Tax=Convolutriloba macropyga TaxID=536237 RepID=UPI003F51DDD1